MARGVRPVTWDDVLKLPDWVLDLLFGAYSGHTYDKGDGVPERLIEDGMAWMIGRATWPVIGARDEHEVAAGMRRSIRFLQDEGTA